VNLLEFRSRWSELHGGVEIQGVIKGWLTISFAIARVLNLFRITPNIVTTVGLIASAAICFTTYTWQLIVLVIFSLICDGVDGSLAIYGDRASKFGELYDSVADRISEALWLVGAAYVGVPVRWAIAIWVLGATQEYARARLASLGYTEIGVVTPTERPVRAIFVIAVTLTFWFGYEVATELAVGFTALSAISVLIVMRMARSILK
jgi:CDP-diacylglycerol--glycerol-3-phosphate 3-phosphatidyltransferase